MRLFFPLSSREAKEQNITFLSKINREAVFPTRLRELRDEANQALKNEIGIDTPAERLTISQEKLAQIVGVRRATIGLYENGDSIPDIETFTKIAQFYGVSFDYLLREDGAKHLDNVVIHDEIGLTDKTILSLKYFNSEIYGNDERMRKRKNIFYALVEAILCKGFSELFTCSVQLEVSAKAQANGENYMRDSDPILKAATNSVELQKLIEYGHIALEPSEAVGYFAHELADTIKDIVLVEYERVLKETTKSKGGERTDAKSSEDQ